MKKVIKEYGNSKIILITKEEMIIHNLKVGDIIDVKIKKVKK